MKTTRPSICKSGSAFTLIEVLVTIAVIGVLAGIVLSVMNPLAQFQKANDSRRKADLNQVQKALEQYYQDAGKYPSNPATPGDYRIVDLSGTTKDWGSSFTPYIDLLPKDPSSSRKYVYVSSLSGQGYQLYASLERGGNDPQSCNPGTGNKCTNAPADACGASPIVCNYGVSSPNLAP